MYFGSVWSWLLTAVLGATPAVLMTVEKGASALFYVLFAVSLGAWALSARRAQWRLEGFGRDWKPLLAALALMVAAVLASQAWHGDLKGTAIEKALRFASMAPLLWLFLHVPPGRLRQVQWGLALGAAVSALLLIFPLAVTHSRPNTAAYTPYNAVSFGNLTCLFGVLCLFAAVLPAEGPRGRAGRWLKLAAAAAALYGFVQSETRSGWLAIPVFALVALAIFRQVPLRRRLAAFAIVLAGGAAVGALDPNLHSRLREGVRQWTQCQDDPLKDTSVCIRVQLAGAAGRMFLSSPLLGVGDGNFRSSLRTLQAQGHVSANVAAEYGETHNDLLYYLAVYGLAGVAALLALYLVPAWYFVRRLGAADLPVRVAAAMGLSFCLGFAVFGLTEMMFRGMRTVSFYSMWVAALLALSYPRAAASPGRAAPAAPRSAVCATAR